MVLAVVLGALSGAIAFLPLLAGLRLTKRTTATSALGPMAVLIIALLVSFGLALGLAILFATWDKPDGFPFVLAEVVALSASAIAFGLYDRRRH